MVSREREGLILISREPAPRRPTGETRSRQARARPPAIWVARWYFEVGVEECAMEAEVSTMNQTGRDFGDSYSLTWGVPVRAVTRQSMALTGSPGT